MGSAIQRICTRCRVCNFHPLEEIYSLGKLYVSDFVDDTSTSTPEKVPLDLVLCNQSSGGCGLLQLKHTVSHETMYRNYWYRSGMNKTMSEELQRIAAKVQSLVTLSSGDSVVDIGANDGTLLRGYKVTGLKTIGFEPARNLLQYNRVGTTHIINDFFNAPAWKKTYGSAQAKAITAIAMFYDLDDPNAFVADVVTCLDPEGVFIIQMSYLPSMLSQNAFDNICHEHVEYYSLLSLENLLKRHNLEVCDVELNDINGGSFRVYIKHKNAGTTIMLTPGAPQRVAELRATEARLGLDTRGIYDAFFKRIDHVKKEVYRFVTDEIKAGKKVYVYGASTKGNTLLQFFNLDHTLITAAAERNADKWGKKTIGTSIPIISEEQARAEKPDYFLILPWHFLKEFKERERAFLERGGRFIVPLPEFKIVQKEQ